MHGIKTKDYLRSGILPPDKEWTYRSYDIGLLHLRRSAFRFARANGCAGKPLPGYLAIIFDTPVQVTQAAPFPNDDACRLQAARPESGGAVSAASKAVSAAVSHPSPAC